jgi:hypothetical protein
LRRPASWGYSRGASRSPACRTLTYIVDRLVHPLALVVFTGLEDAAPVDVAEQFIARAI